MGCNHCNHTSDKNELCVAKVPIFNHLTYDEMQEVVQVAYQREYRKREVIFQAEESSSNLYIVHHGRVKIYRLSESGKEQLVRILTPGDFTGEYALFAQTDTTSFAEAMEDTELCTITREDMYDLILKHPTISIKILEQLSTRLNESEKQFEDVNIQDVESRVASYLINLIEDQPATGDIDLTLPMSKKDLASLIGTSRETLSRKLSLFQQKGLITQSGQRHIMVKDVKKLKAIILV